MRAALGEWSCKCFVVCYPRARRVAGLAEVAIARRIDAVPETRHIHIDLALLAAGCAVAHASSTLLGRRRLQGLIHAALSSCMRQNMQRSGSSSRSHAVSGPGK